MTHHEIAEFLGKRVAVYTTMGSIKFGYLQRTTVSTFQYEILNSPSHIEIEAHREPFNVGDVQKIGILTDELEQKFRLACTCADEMIDWVFCPVHGPTGEDFPNHL